MTWLRNLRFEMGTQNLVLRCIMAEFLGTFIVVCLGTSAIAQGYFSVNYNATTGAIGYGIAYMMGMYVAMGVTGGHLNPCVTLVTLLQQKIHAFHAIGYVIAQLLGAFLANACVFGVYKDALDKRLPSKDLYVTPQFDSIYTSYPHPDSGEWIGFADQIMASALLVIMYLAVTDDENGAPPLGLRPFFIGLSYISIGYGFTYNTTPGPSCNPARDFAGRVFVSMAGWKKYPFSIYDDNWFWIPIIAPLLGALIGLVVYQLFIALHEPLTEEERSRAEERYQQRNMAGMPGGASFGQSFSKSNGGFNPNNFPTRRY